MPTRRRCCGGLYFDLIGLPPTAEEVDAFVAACANNPAARQQAFAAVVDRAARLAAVRRTLGAALARHRPLRRVERQRSQRHVPACLAVSRLRHSIVQRRQAVRSFRHRANRRRSAARTARKKSEPSILTATGFLAIGSKPNAKGNPNFHDGRRRRSDRGRDDVDHGPDGRRVLAATTTSTTRCRRATTTPWPESLRAPKRCTAPRATRWAALRRPSCWSSTRTYEPAVSADKEADREATTGKARSKASRASRARNGGLPTYPAGTPLAMGVRDRAAAVDCRINIKGEAKQLGAAVPRGFVQVCSLDRRRRRSTRKTSGRLQLAQWLTDPAHPLTARVMANRVWHHLFGQGHRQHARQLRPARRAADASRIARLPGDAVPHRRLVDQEVDSQHRAEPHLSNERSVRRAGVPRSIPTTSSSGVINAAGSMPNRSATPCLPTSGQLDLRPASVRWWRARRSADPRQADARQDSEAEQSPQRLPLHPAQRRARGADRVRSGRSEPDRRRSQRDDRAGAVVVLDEQPVRACKPRNDLPSGCWRTESSGDVDARVRQGVSLGAATRAVVGRVARAREFVERETATASATDRSRRKRASTTEAWAVFCQALLSFQRIPLRRLIDSVFRPSVTSFQE